MTNKKVMFIFENEPFVLERLTVKTLFTEEATKLIFKVNRQGGTIFMRQCHLKSDGNA